MTLTSPHAESVAGLRAAAIPAVPYRHLIRMSDDTGLFEHARGPIPKRWHGYCVDDVARGLVVVSREPEPTPELVELAEIYLAFLMHAQDPAGAFRNRMGFDRRWKDEPQLSDCWGRALWGLGTAAARGGAPWIRTIALECFERGATLRSPHIRSMAFAALGAAEVAAADPGHATALALLADAAACVGRPTGDPDRPWPHPRLTYADAALPEVLLAAGAALDDRDLLTDGLRLLDWLLDDQTRDGHLSVTPAGGRPATGPHPVPEHQQPIEVAALADACARAYALTGDERWLAGVERAVRWFLGENDGGMRMIDGMTGGGFDGLYTEGRNRNQGAESTLAMMAVLQHGARWAAMQQHGGGGNG